MRLIDADAIFSNELLLISAECYDAMHAVIEKINNAPTIDAVEVVRCKDCKYYEGEWCCMNEIVMVDDDYCSCGKRK